MIDDVLSPAEVAALNALVDERAGPPGTREVFEASEEELSAHAALRGQAPPAKKGLVDDVKTARTGSPIRFGSSGGGAPGSPGFLNWGQEFVDLLLHPRIIPFMREFLDSSGYGVRLDRLYGMHMASQEVMQLERTPGQKGGPRGTAFARYPMGLHQGVTPYIPSETYFFKDGKPQVSFLVFTWALTESGGDKGGFVNSSPPSRLSPSHTHTSAAPDRALLSVAGGDTRLA